MNIDRSRLYRFPWSMTDNPGGWVEVTDSCNLACPGCYRQRTEGHRPLEDVLADIDACREITNCDSIKISGGEPLLYPHIIDVVRFISQRGLKPFLITNGLALDRPAARELAKAGLKSVSVHVDGAQDRPGWEKRSEKELNDLRQFYADMMWEFRDLTCGFVTTVSRKNLRQVPSIVEWSLKNIDKVSHLSFIALRGILAGDGVSFYAGGRKLEAEDIPNRMERASDISITSEEMLDVIRAAFPGVTPCAYIGGTAFPETNKYLVSVNVGTREKSFGAVGPRTVEMSQIFTHLAKGKYAISDRRPKVGRKIFLLAAVDREVRKSLFRFLKESVRHPSVFFGKIYVQPLALEQPIEIIDGETNACDGCINMMIFRQRIIPSCRLDEYRRFGSTIKPQKKRPAGEISVAWNKS
jgi:organic radical activating enzyme